MLITALLFAATLPGFRIQATDGYDYTQENLSKHKLNVWVFVLPECPISNQYAPEINRIIKEYKPIGVDFSLVHVETTATATSAKLHAKQFGYTCRILLDKNQSLVKIARATKVPEVAVVTQNGTIVYLGRIDNLYFDLGKRRKEVTRKDLRIAIQETLNGKNVSVPKTDVIGCYIPNP